MSGPDTPQAHHLAVVTGASRGIGQAIALRLAAAGLAVAVVSRTVDDGDATLAGSVAGTVRMITESGGTAAGFPADLADPDLDLAGLVARIEDGLQIGADVLVNNAAATRRYSTLFADMRRDWFADSVQTNVWAGWALAAAMIPRMRERGAGWILNISSRQAGPRVGPPFAPHPLAGSVLYGATKAMIDRITTGAAMELHADNIAVNALAPNRGVATEHAAAAVPGWPSEPLETMAEAALLLCTADPQVVTGRVAYSLPLLVEFDRQVRTLDGSRLLPGWQPADMDPSGFLPDYLRFALPPPLPNAQPKGTP